MEVREVHGQGVLLWRGCAFGRLVPVVCMVVNWIPGQMALLDPPIATGVPPSFPAWQLRPARDCGISPRRPSSGAVVPREHGCAKSALEIGWNKTLTLQILALAGGILAEFRKPDY